MIPVVGTRTAAQKTPAAGRLLAPSAKVADPRRYGRFSRRIPLTFDNTGRPQRDDWAVAIPVKQIKAVAADFNPGNCAIVASQRWIDWREIPHQVDQIDPTVGPELSFIIDAPAGAKTKTAITPGRGSDSTAPCPTKSNGTCRWGWNMPAPCST